MVIFSFVYSKNGRSLRPPTFLQTAVNTHEGIPYSQNELLKDVERKYTSTMHRPYQEISEQSFLHEYE